MTTARAIKLLFFSLKDRHSREVLERRMVRSADAAAKKAMPSTFAKEFTKVAAQVGNDIAW